jgi:hypothetical protein
MEIMIMNIRKIVAGGLLVIATPLTFAANIALYAQPNPNSPVVSKVQSPDNLIEIINGKHGWVKVADRSNGQVGWVNTSPKHCKKKQKIQNAINQLDEMQKQLQAQHQEAMIQFDIKMKQIDQQRQEAVNLLNQRGAKHNQSSNNNTESQNYSFSKNINYTGGQNAQVTETIVKNGKKEIKTYEIPVN